MPRYHLEISEVERIQLTVALAHRTVELELAGQLERSESHLVLMRRLWEVPKLPEGTSDGPRPVGIPAAASTARAAGAQGNSPTAPERVSAPSDAAEFGELTISPVSVEQSGKAMVVTYQIRTGGKVRTSKMRCWDPKLFSDLIATAGQVTTFLTKESKGFTNIVGVKR